ncbi:MAG: copper amine oxidase N-terminal domain-containing protein, partial [Peptococcaceae bacterium]|nr:copper amine oxidase N-terminal domain-containing protein [Peptococcaceae bacterium]
MNKHAGRHVLQAMALQVLTLIVLLLIAVFPAMADDGISVTVDGKSLSFDVPPQLIQNRTMVPMRAIFEALGADVDWNGASSTVTATTVDSVVVMQIGNAEITVDGKKILLDVPPMLIDNRTLVPVRAVAEGLKSDVLWDEATKRVIITSKDSALRPVSLYLPN